MKVKRIYYTWDKWECYPAGFYEENIPKDWKGGDPEEFYRKFLSDLPLFEKNLERVITEWKHSCEHYLTNENMNRIAWLGQASVCIYSGLPSRFRGGYNLLTDEQKVSADEMALKYLNKWLVSNGYDEVSSINEAASKTEANLY